MYGMYDMLIISYYASSSNIPSSAISNLGTFQELIACRNFNLADIVLLRTCDPRHGDDIMINNKKSSQIVAKR